MQVSQPNSIQSILFSCCVSSTLCTTLLNPLDVIRVRIQQKVSVQSNQGILNTTRNLFNSEGKSVFLRGLKYSILMQNTGQAIFFQCYEAAKQRVRRAIANETLCPLISSTIAGVVKTVLVFPLEMARTIQFSGQQFKLNLNPKNYSGFCLTLSKDLVGMVTYFTVAEYVKRRISETYSRESVFLNTFVGGAVGGICSCFAANPLDVLKTQKQIHLDSLHQSTYLLARQIFHERGIRGFFSGVQVRLIRSILSGGLALGIYEKLLHSYNNIFNYTCYDYSVANSFENLEW